jgi:ABC-type amino acid transport system permease subunit
MFSADKFLHRSKDRFQEVQVIKGKVSQLLNTYCKNSQHMSNLGSAELMTYFSTSLNQTNQCNLYIYSFIADSK